MIIDWGGPAFWLIGTYFNSLGYVRIENFTGANTDGGVLVDTSTQGYIHITWRRRH